MGSPLRYRIVTWDEVVELSERLARKVERSGYRPDTVISLTRGGWVPARIVSDILDVHNLYSIRVEYYKGSVHGKRAVVTHSLPVNINGKRVLMVDDISHTGSSLRAVCAHLLRRFRPAEFRIAALHVVEGTKVMPDYYVGFSPASRPTWFIYPWHFWEDARRLVGEILRERPGVSLGELRRELRRRHGLKTDSVSDERLRAVAADARLLIGGESSLLSSRHSRCARPRGGTAHRRSPSTRASSPPPCRCASARGGRTRRAAP